MIRLHFFLFIIAINLFAYDYPKGIPTAWVDVDIERPARPADWSSEQAGYYFINYGTGSNTHTYGTPSAPRQTIPNPIPAGSYVEIEGTYSYVQGGSILINADGTSESYVWLVGKAGSEAVFDEKTYVYGTYLIIDSLEWQESCRPRSIYPAHHILFRNIDFNMGGGEGSICAFGGTSEYPKYDIVFYNNIFHDTSPYWDNGDGTDPDNHGIKPSGYVNDIWILNNEFYNIGGSPIQVGDQATDHDDTYNIYIGGNEIHASRQSSVGVKKASDVIISGNEMYDAHITYNNAGNLCGGVVYQYAPRRVWIIFNEMHDLDHGVKNGSGTDPREDYAYIIGNVIYDLAQTSASTDCDGWEGGAAMQLTGVEHTYVVNNTIYDSWIGIESPRDNQYLYIENNLVSTINYDHIRVQYSGTANNGSLKNNLLYNSGGENLKYGSCTDQTLAENSYDVDCLNSDPKFTDAGNDDFTLQSGSPAINAGLSDTLLTVDVYALFESLYGLDIRVDIEGNTRPQDTQWDIGAYEYTGSVSQDTDKRADILKIGF